MKSVGVLYCHSVVSMKGRVEHSGNSIITSVRQSSAYVCDSIGQAWLGVLFVQFEGSGAMPKCTMYT